MAPIEDQGTDLAPHAGVLWEKVVEMGLPEKELIAAFDTKEDFINYLGRQPKMDWDTVKGQLAGGKVTSTDDLREKAKSLEPKADKKPSLKDIERRVKALEKDEATDAK
jgi:hypothetical protein